MRTTALTENEPQIYSELDLLKKRIEILETKLELLCDKLGVKIKE